MSVVGFDIGNDGCFVAEIKRGGVDMVLNENSNRRTPNLVSIQEGKTRLTGEQASAIAKSNFKNTVSSVKPYIGRTFKECEEELKTSPVKAVEMKDGSIGWEVNYNDAQTVFSCQQILAMVIKELCKTVVQAKNDGTDVRDCVIAVPGYFTESQRLAILDSCEISGVKALGLINELTAVALGFGIWKSARNLFHESEPQNVMFVDIGLRSTSVCIASFVQGKLVIKSCAYALQGSGDVDMLIAKEMAATYKEKHGEDPMLKPKALIKLLAAADKAKKTISPEGVKLAQATIECLMGDYDLNYRLELEKYDELVAPFLASIEEPLKKCMADAGMGPKDLDTVEIVGGGSRIKGVKRTISKIMELDAEATNFGVATTMNADEAVARGCALMCAMRSPRFSVKAFDVVDVAQYPTMLTYPVDSVSEVTVIKTDEKKDGEEKKEGEGKEGEGKEGDAMDTEGNNSSNSGSLDLVAEGTTIPQPLKAAFTLKPGVSDFELRCAIPTGEDASLYKQFVANTADAMEVDGAKAGLELVRYNVSVSGDAATSPVELLVEHDANGVLGVKLLNSKNSIAAEQVTITTSSLGKLSAGAITELVQAEATMAAQDEALIKCADKRNELETFLYAFRDELAGSLSEYMEADEKSGAEANITATEDWLYSDEGFDSTLELYSAKLVELSALQQKPVVRKEEGQQRPAAVEGLQNALTKYVTMAGDLPGSADHATDKQRVSQLHQQVESWLNGLKAQQEPLPKTVDAVLTVAMLRHKTKLIERLHRQVSSIIELRKNVASSAILNYTPGASNSVVRNLSAEDIKLLQAEALKAKDWLTKNVDEVTEYKLPEKEDGRPSPSSTECDTQKKNVMFVEEKAKALSELRTKMLEVRALKESSAATEAAAAETAAAAESKEGETPSTSSASGMGIGPHTFAGLSDSDWGLVTSECDEVEAWLSSKANVDSTVPSAADCRKRVKDLDSVVKKADCVSTLRGNIAKYSAVLETQKEAEQYAHVTPGGWDSLQAAVDKAFGYCLEHLEGKKEGADPVVLKKFPAFQGNITSATDNLVKTSDAILFPPTPATNAPPAPNAEAKEGESKEGDLEKKGDNKAADMDLD